MQMVEVEVLRTVEIEVVTWMVGVPFDEIVLVTGQEVNVVRTL